MAEYNEILITNVDIQKGKCNNYLITLLDKNAKFTDYQSFSYIDPVLNKDRHVMYISQKLWLETFNIDNHYDNFTPTVIMEHNNKLYAFVINSAKMLDCRCLQFNVSTTSIDKTTNDVSIKLPIGKNLNMRFDIQLLSIGNIISESDLYNTDTGLDNTTYNNSLSNYNNDCDDNCDNNCDV